MEYTKFVEKNFIWAVGAKEATAKEDILEGTDCWSEGYRLDVTLNENKSHIENLGSEYGNKKWWDITSLIESKLGKMLHADIKLGIRRGNGVVRFEEHTLVVLLTLPYQYTEVICENIGKVWKELMSETIGFFYESFFEE